jgi:2-(1,2-epoxy-1,2-dihydrophenyl)acetyl-CoA isomerase
MTHRPPDAPLRGDETPPAVAPLVRCERSADDDRIAVVVIDNPTARNGLTSASAAELGRLIREADEDPGVRAIVLTGAGDHFCSGADLRHGASIMKDGEAGIRRHLSEGFHVAVRALAGASKPTLAVIRGACVGFGFDLALAADLRICATDAMFAQVFSKIGLVPDGGSSFHLSRLVGLGKAMEIFLLGDRLSGEEAAAAGLVNRAVPKNGLDALAADWAGRLASGPPIAFRLGKQNIRAGAADSTLHAALAREEDAQVTCLQSRDAWTAVQAFFLKQKPEFKGQ